MIGQLVLVVDDEPSIVQLERLYLEREGYRTSSASDGKVAIQAIETQHPNLVILDITLPEVDGLEVCRRLRAMDNQVPILMVTARDEDIDKILGLEMGADDYLTKPFNPRELVARVKAILRRGERQANVGNPPVLRIADLEIDASQREVRVNGQPVDLRTQEFEVILALAQHAGRVLTRENLLNLAWGYEFYGQTRTVDVHIAQLRRKLAGSRTHIETITGIGYKLVP